MLHKKTIMLTECIFVCQLTKLLCTLLKYAQLHLQRVVKQNLDERNTSLSSRRSSPRARTPLSGAHSGYKRTIKAECRRAVQNRARSGVSVLPTPRLFGGITRLNRPNTNLSHREVLEIIKKTTCTRYAGRMGACRKRSATKRVRAETASSVSHAGKINKSGLIFIA